MNSDKRRDLMLIENAFVTTLVFAIFRLKHTHTHREACVNFPPSWVICIRDRLLLASLSQMHDSWKVPPILANIHICVPSFCPSLSLSAAVSLTRSLHRLFFCFPHWTLRLDRKFSPSCLLTYLLLISFAVCCLFHLPLSLPLSLLSSTWRDTMSTCTPMSVHDSDSLSHCVSCWVICWFRRDF